MNTKMRVFWISLVLSTSRILTDWASPIVHNYLIPWIGNYTEYYMFIFDLLGIILSLIAIFVGYRIGRNTDYKSEYEGFIKFIGIGWIASSLVCVPSYLFVDSAWRELDAIPYVFTVGLNVCAILFSSITLGWIARDGFQIKREWNPVILRPVLVYNGLLLLRPLLQRTISFIRLNNSNPGAFSSWQMSVIRWSVLPIELWFLVRMLSSGRRIDLKEDYGSVIYTFWVSSVALLTLSELVSIAYYYARFQSLSMLSNLPWTYVRRLIWSTHGILGLPFALLCYGYINSKSNTSPTEILEDE